MGAMLAACGGGSTAAVTYSVGGTLSGLAAGQSVVVQDASGASGTLSANGSYTVLASVPTGTTYSLSIRTQPTGQVCSIVNPSGTVAAASVTGVAVNCASTLMLLAGDIGGQGNINGTGSGANFDGPLATAIDSSGNVYVADSGNNTIRKITPAGVVSTLAGLAGSSGSTDGTGTVARFHYPSGVAVDSVGNVYVADQNNSTIRKVTPAGVVSTLAGLAGNRNSTDATGAAGRFFYPTAVAVDGAGNVYVADRQNHNIRKITPAGVVSTLAGPTGSAVSSGGADGIGTEARFNGPYGVAVDSGGNVYVADSGNNAIRKITPAGVVSTLAGSAGTSGSTDATGTAARFNAPVGVAVDSVGNVYVSDQSNQTLRKITSAGLVSTLAGSVGSSGSADGTSTARFSSPAGIAVDGAGNVYLADSGNHAIRKITPAGVVSTPAGSAVSIGSTDATAAAARFNTPSGVTVDGAGNVYVADRYNHTIRKITPAGVVSTLAGSVGNGAWADATGTLARFNAPIGVAVDSAGNVYVADSGNNTIRKITPAGVVTTLAGVAGTFGSADGTSAARFNFPTGVAVDGAGNVYVADQNNHTIRKITPAGVVSTLAGSAGTSGSTNATGAAASFSYPNSVVVDSAGNLYVADGNFTIRKITPAGVVSTVAGSPGIRGSTDATGTAARFGSLSGIAVDSVGNVYVADNENSTVRQVTAAGVVTTVVGVVGSRGVSLSTLPASLTYPAGVVVAGGKVFITTNNAVVWAYTP